MDFNKRQTQMAKGIAILFMLFHHLFSYREDVIEEYRVSFAPLSMQTVTLLAVAAKICVGIFVFLSAFGMTRSYHMKLQEGQTALERTEEEHFVFRRLRKLLSGYLFIYVIALLVFLLTGRAIPVYRTDGTWKALIFAFLDALGLASFMGTPTINVTWWYMSIAIVMIVLLPILVRWVKRDGLLVVGLAAFAGYFNITTTSFGRYLFVFVCGVYCAEYRILERLGTALTEGRSRSTYLLGTGVSVLAFPLLYYTRIRTGWDYWLDAFLAMDLCLMIYLMTFEGKEGLLQKGLLFIGRYSMTVFLTHTFIYYYYFTGFIYSFHNWLLIYVVMVLCSLLLAVVLEQIKSLFGRVLHHAV